MDYCLDAGDGTASIWTSDPDVDLDGDGALDAVRLDLDGDGLFDDALGDLDADGEADHAALGLDAADRTLYTDDGTGAWAVAGGLPPRPLRWFDLDGVEHSGDLAADVDRADDRDVDGDGRGEVLFDVDRDGLADRALRAGEDGSVAGYPVQGYVDTDGDGRWDLLLRDADGDGAADGATDL
ncbi:MAG TPA: pullulanase [Mycobacterium sp.]|nr:MAG: pullulanase [Mycobacterium sp.]HOB49053.1 pullulanase [Mycobacterium sp.]HPZ93828.1 pullulanase [Mycobacterium sp.]HQE14638.1 pullulanase [Mycobacterium sp.]